MPLTLSGSGSITGLSVGGLPDGSVDADTLAAGAAGGGKVNQIVQKTSDLGYDLSNTSTWTAVSSDLDLAITTTTNSSKVLVQTFSQVFQDGNDWTAYFTFMRDSDSNNLGHSVHGLKCLYFTSGGFSTGDFIRPIHMSVLDTPGNAGTYTYKIFHKGDRSDSHWNQATGDADQGRNARNVILLTEILA